MSSFFSVRGLPELKQLFAKVSDDAAKTPLRRGVSAGARIVKEAVKAAAPVRQQITGKRGSKRRPPGALKAAVIMKFDRAQSKGGQAVMLVTVRRGTKKQIALGKDAYYAKFVERGHRIVRRSKRIGTYRGKALYQQSIRSRRAGSMDRVAPRPFMAPAFAASRDRAAIAMVEVMTQELEKILPK